LTNRLSKELPFQIPLNPTEKPKAPKAKDIHERDTLSIHLPALPFSEKSCEKLSKQGRHFVQNLETAACTEEEMEL